MNMKVIDVKKGLCTCCMEEHEVKTVSVRERTAFKNVPVEYDAVYHYCDNADELFADEEMMSANDIYMKDAYRRKCGLLTSSEISAIRAKYGISQSDMCLLLGWGGKTITRYESHQVQDKAHDTILKKVDSDPEWFLTLLSEAQDLLSPEAYDRYRLSASRLYESDEDGYLRRAIEAKYARFSDKPEFTGGRSLSLDKVVDVIRYFAGAGIAELYKVKLMKLLWYADALSYKERGHSITGLVYLALPMGAVPIGHDFIIDLKGVPCEEVYFGDNTAYHFELSEKSELPSLDKEDLAILEKVASRFSSMSKSEIVAFMHKEQAFTQTPQREAIDFRYCEALQI